MSVADSATPAVTAGVGTESPPAEIEHLLDTAVVPEMDYASYRRWENLHIYLWLFKDLCWVNDWAVLGTVMIVPTLAFAVLILVLMRANRVDFLHNLAVLLWITANSIWMVGEFYFNDRTRPVAIVFFVAGILLLTSYYGTRLLRRRLRS